MALGDQSILRVRRKMSTINPKVIKVLEMELFELISLPSSRFFESDTEWGKKNIDELKIVREQLDSFRVGTIEKLKYDTETWLKRQEIVNNEAREAEARAQYSN